MNLQGLPLPGHRVQDMHPRVGIPSLHTGYKLPTHLSSGFRHTYLLLSCTSDCVCFTASAPALLMGALSSIPPPTVLRLPATYSVTLLCEAPPPAHSTAKAEAQRGEVTHPDHTA